ncbi:uncharacterized protein LOC114446062 [Parambassis ranga]|uniref:Uncharacterized protein LOC114446062 n=1 Tax=Parambassis ranga TaxID=210632 RepID=A0A6P7JKI6_9TELE|nr:uncharacterized protein LOC114446062 [Parambassis ranga]
MSKILEASNLTFTHEGINMADQMGKGEPHTCQAKIEVEIKARPDLQTEPLPQAEDVFTDGCCFRKPNNELQAGYAVVRRKENEFEVVCQEEVTERQSAQRAEVLAMIAALKWSKGKRVNIYTDSAYVVGAAITELPQWQRTGFLTADEKPIKHEQEMRELLEALQEPQAVAIIKCRGHSGENTLIGRGNEAADQAAKGAAGYVSTLQMVTTEKILPELRPRLSIDVISDDQNKASPQEKTV